MINTDRIKMNLNMMTTAVNGLLSATDDAEKNAWTVIYNARQEAIIEELGKDNIEPVLPTEEPKPFVPATEEVAEQPTPEITIEEVAEKPIEPEKFVLDE